MIFRSFLSVCFFLIAIQGFAQRTPSAAAQPSGWQTRIYQHSRQLDESVKRVNAVTLSRITDTTRRELGNLLNTLQRTNPDLKTANPEYYSSLQLIDSTMVLVNDATSHYGQLSPDSIQQIKTMLSLVNRDIRIKNSKAVSLENGILTEVRVNVNTFKIQGNAVAVSNGYTVKCNPFRWANEFSHPRYCFTNPTSPSIKPLPPGSYVMWIEKDGRRVQSKTVDVGEEGKPEQEVRFDVTQ